MPKYQQQLPFDPLLVDYTEYAAKISCKCVPVTMVERVPKRVIFHGPATIVIWSDGEKTVVKCQPDETMDREKAIAMAIAKRALGNKGNYYEVIKKCLSMAEETE